LRTHTYEVRPRKAHRGVDLISDVLPYGALWYAEPNAVGHAISYAKFRSRSQNAVIRVYDETGNVIEKVSSRGLGHFHPARRRSNFRCAAIRFAVVWQAECSQQRNRLREVSQPLT
jgi:hypothetical protein